MVDGHTASEIDRLVDRLLRDIDGRPPLDLTSVLAHLSVDLSYYDLEDPGLIRRFTHRAKLRGQHLASSIAAIARKVRLHALWLPDAQQIFVDSSLPSPKQRWASHHDVIHRLLPWHREFFCWDTAQTLDPVFQEALEAEANYGASALMFCGQRFTRDALDTVPNWASVKLLAKRNGASLAATLRRYVQHSHDRAMAAVISTPRWLPLRHGDTARIRHCDLSTLFLREFGTISPSVLGALLDVHTSPASGGPVGDFYCTLPDLRGDARTFRVEAFFNRHDVLALFVEHRRSAGRSSRVASAGNARIRLSR